MSARPPLPAIRQAIQWYSAHLALTQKANANKTPAPKAVMISDDADNLAKAKATGITAFSGALGRLPRACSLASNC